MGFKGDDAVLGIILALHKKKKNRNLFKYDDGRTTLPEILGVTADPRICILTSPCITLRHAPGSKKEEKLALPGLRRSLSKRMIFDMGPERWTWVYQAQTGRDRATLPSGISRHIPRPCSALLCTGAGLSSLALPLAQLNIATGILTSACSSRAAATGPSWAIPPTVLARGKRGLFFPRPPLNSHAFPRRCLAQLPEHRGNSQEMRRGVWGFQENTPPFPFVSCCTEHGWRAPVFGEVWQRVWSQDSWKKFRLGLLGCDITRYVRILRARVSWGLARPPSPAVRMSVLWKDWNPWTSLVGGCGWRTDVKTQTKLRVAMNTYRNTLQFYAIHLKTTMR